MELHERGVLERYGVELIGAQPQAIELAEDRQLFKEAMLAAGLAVPRGRHRRTASTRRWRWPSSSAIRC